MLDFTNFFIGKPRVLDSNAFTTFPPTTSGTASFSNTFEIKYEGTGSEVFLQISSDIFKTIVDDDNTHVDNLDLNITDTFKTIGSLVQEITGKPYSVSGYSSSLDGLFTFLKGIEKQDLTSSFQVEHGVAEEFLIEASSTGDFGTVTVNHGISPFEYSNTDQKWIKDVFETENFTVPSDGKISLDYGATIELAENTSADDLTDTLSVVDETLLESAAEGTVFVFSPTFKTIQPGADFSLNGVPIAENVDYLIDEATSQMWFTENRDIQLSASTPPNITSAFIPQIPSTNFGIGGIILGQPIKDINGDIIDITYTVDTTINEGAGAVSLVPDTEVVYTITEERNSQLMGDGSRTFIEIKDNFAPAEYVLFTEDALFADDFTIYRNGIAMVLNQEYTINVDTGWVNLITPAFPNETFTISYKNKDLGDITNEILGISKTPSEIAAQNPSDPTLKQIASGASILGANEGAFVIEAGISDTLKIIVNATTETITLTPGLTVSTDVIVNDINSSATNFTAENSSNKILLTSNSIGPTVNLKIGDGSANFILGFTENDESNGVGASGGEKTLEAFNPPLIVTSVSATEGGNTLIVKNINISANYPSDSIIELNSDLYIVNSATTDAEPNLISTNPGVYKISLNLNNQLRVKVDGVSKAFVLTTGDNLTAQDIVNDINLTEAGTAEVVNLNGEDLIRLKGTTSVEIEEIDYNAASTLGFSVGDIDDSRLDTLITIEGQFIKDYSNPSFKSTRTAISFSSQATSFLNASPGTNKIIFASDVTNEIVTNTALKIFSTDPITSSTVSTLYKVVGVQFSEIGTTEVTLNNNLVFPLYSTDSIEFSNKPLLQNGATSFFITPRPFLGTYPPISATKFDLTYDGVLKERDVDYKVDESGKIDLGTFELDGKSLIIDYIGQKALPENAELRTNYNIFVFLQPGDSLKGTFEFKNPDQFYFQIKRERALAVSLMEELEEEIKKLQNPSSSGVSAAAPSTSTGNSDGGRETPSFEISVPEEKGVISQKYFDFYNDWINLVEEMLQKLIGDVVGSDDGKIVQSDIDDALNVDPSRLFPATIIPDDLEDLTIGIVGGEDDEQYREKDPFNLPVLRGLTQNDDGTSGNPDYENETNALNMEKAALTDLLVTPLTTGSLEISSKAASSESFPVAQLIFSGLTSIFMSVDDNSSEELTEITGFTTPPGGYTGPDIANVISVINATFPGAATQNGSTVKISGAISLRVETDTSNFFPADSNFLTVTPSDEEFPSLTYREYASRANHSQNSLFRIKSLDYQQTSLTAYQTNTDSLKYGDLTQFDTFKTFETDILDKIDTDLTTAVALDITSASEINTRIALLTDRLNDASSEITRLKNIEDTLNGFIDTDSLRSLRYVWLVKLVNKQEGFLQRVQQIITDQAEKERKKEQNSVLV